jgi:hypothetical protein
VIFFTNSLSNCIAASRSVNVDHGVSKKLISCRQRNLLNVVEVQGFLAGISYSAGTLLESDRVSAAQFLCLPIIVYNLDFYKTALFERNFIL